jgi:hypothetical protein
VAQVVRPSRSSRRDSRSNPTSSLKSPDCEHGNHFHNLTGVDGCLLVCLSGGVLVHRALSLMLHWPEDFSCEQCSLPIKKFRIRTNITLILKTVFLISSKRSTPFLRLHHFICCLRYIKPQIRIQSIILRILEINYQLK